MNGHMESIQGVSPMESGEKAKIPVPLCVSLPWKLRWEKPGFSHTWSTRRQTGRWAQLPSKDKAYDAKAPSQPSLEAKQMINAGRDTGGGVAGNINWWGIRVGKEHLDH